MQPDTSWNKLFFFSQGRTKYSYHHYYLLQKPQTDIWARISCLKERNILSTINYSGLNGHTLIHFFCLLLRSKWPMAMICDQLNWAIKRQRKVQGHIMMRWSHMRRLKIWIWIYFAFHGEKSFLTGTCWEFSDRKLGGKNIQICEVVKNRFLVNTH